MDYIIVQAGGKGTRMQQLTANKPKALVPVDNLPMIFHLFRKYPDKKFIVIGDYKFDVLQKYLATFGGGMISPWYVPQAKAGPARDLGRR